MFTKKRNLTRGLLLMVITAMLLSIAISGCGGGGASSAGGGGSNPLISADPVRLTSLQISPVNSRAAAGTSQQIDVTGIYSNMETADLTRSVSFSTSDNTIASINSKGLLKAEKKGKITINARESSTGLSCSTDFEVTDALLVSVNITPSRTSVAKGIKQQFQATGTFTDFTTQDLTDQVTWKSSSGAIADISAAGSASSAGAGTCVISAVHGSTGKTCSANLTVTNAVVERIQVTDLNPSVANGLTKQMAATAILSDKTTQDVTDQVVWGASDANIASISDTGLITSLGKGSCVITAQYPGGEITDSTNLTVTNAAVKIIEISSKEGTTSVSPDFKLDLDAAGVLTDNTVTPLDGTNATWVSSNTVVAVVEPDTGVVTAVSPGAAAITCTYPGTGTVATVNITVAAATHQSTQINVPSLTMQPAATQNATASGLFSNASILDITAQTTWASSNAAVATVSNAAGSQGVITAIGNGTTTITATNPVTGVIGTTTVTVTGAALVSINIDQVNPNLPTGFNQQLTVTGIYSDGTSINLTNQVTWTTNNAAAVAVSNAIGAVGAANTIAAGQAVITATLPNAPAVLPAVTTVTVTPATLVSIQVSPQNLSLALNTGQQITAIGIYSDGTVFDLTNQVTWVSSIPANGTVSNTVGTQGIANAGILMGAMSAQTTITAAMPGTVVSGTTTLTTVPVMLMSMTINQIDPAIANGTNTQLTVKGMFNNGTTQDITSQVIWSTVNPATASATNAAGAKGLITAVSPGATQVTASFPGTAIVAATNFTVTNATLTGMDITALNSLVLMNPTIAVGFDQEMTATGLFSDGTTQDITTLVTWTTDNPKSALVSNAAGSQGKVTPLSAGPVNLTAVFPDVVPVQISAPITISAAPLVSIAVDTLPNGVPPFSIIAGLSTQFFATGTFSDGVNPAFTQDITKLAVWASSNAAIAAVSNAAGSQGLTSTAAQGNAVISASIAGAPMGVMPGSAAVTVTPAMLMSIIMQPTNDATYAYRIPTTTIDPLTGLPVVMTYQFKGWGMYSNGQLKDITALLNWTSSNPAAMTINAKTGLGTSVANGLTTITAQDPMTLISGTTEVKIVTQLSGADPAFPKFVDPLPNPPLMPSDPANPNYYIVSQEEVQSQMLPAGYPSTTIWGYGSPAFGVPCQFPGPTFLVTQGTPVTVLWSNNLPPRHILPIDYTLMGADIMAPQNRTVIHLHGGHIPAEFDGYPEAWFTNGINQAGPWFTTNVYTFPNDQEPSTLWYHDHTLGLTHLNPYAGLAGFYLITSPQEAALNLPGTGAGDSLAYLQGICLQDKFFYDDGSLAYPNAMTNGVQASVQPETFGDFSVVNGKTWPYMNVEPRKYQLRLLNGSQARFYNLSFSDPNITFQVVATEQGYLDAPATLNKLLIAPGERITVVVDFAAAAGANLTLLNDAPIPYDPAGYAAAPLPPTDPLAQIMQFRVSAAPPTVADPGPVPNPLRFAGGPMAPIVPLDPFAVTLTRNLTLEEGMDMATGRMKPQLCGLGFFDPVTENPRLNTTEIWSIVNNTPDTHPIHLHLVKFMKLDATPLVLDPLTGVPVIDPVTGQVVPAGPAVGPSPDDAGWKDTLKMNPGEMTRIIMRFDGYTGRYVWHCHILEHEEFDMMRPMDVLP